MPDVGKHIIAQKVRITNKANGIEYKVNILSRCQAIVGCGRPLFAGAVGFSAHLPPKFLPESGAGFGRIASVCRVCQ